MRKSTRRVISADAPSATPGLNRAVVYLRVSDKSQAERDDTEEGYSLPAQREACLQMV